MDATRRKLDELSARRRLHAPPTAGSAKAGAARVETGTPAARPDNPAPLHGPAICAHADRATVIEAANSTLRGSTELLGGCEARNPSGAYWQIETLIDDCSPCGGALNAALDHALNLEASGVESWSGNAGTTLVLDIETGGFAGTPIFLIGLATLGQRPLRILQFLARDYPEEPAILRALADAAAGCDTWVSFNGRSFDEPFLRDRAAVHRLFIPMPREHFDLLHAARRKWRERVPDCRLTTLERHILGRSRSGDVPGRDVPDLFHLFCRTGNAGPLRPVLEHNRLDLLAAAELLVRLVTERNDADAKGD